jgi:hypothetical protein
MIYFDIGIWFDLWFDISFYAIYFGEAINL